MGPKSSGAKYAHYQDCLNDKIKNDAYEYDPEKKKNIRQGTRQKSFHLNRLTENRLLYILAEINLENGANGV